MLTQRRSQRLSRSGMVRLSPMSRPLVASGVPSTQAPFLHRRYPVSSVLRACPPPHAAQPVPRGSPVGELSPPHHRGFPCCVDPLCQHAVAITPVRPRRGSLLGPLPTWSRGTFPLATAAFPIIQVGRLSHCPFRGLLSVYSRYGLLTRGVAWRPFPSKAPTASLPPPPLRLLPAEATSCRAG